MKQDIIDMIEDCGIEVEDIQHIIATVEARAISSQPSAKKMIGTITDQLLTAFDVQIDNEKGERSALNAQPQDKSHHYHNGRVDGVDTGRYLVEKTLAIYDQQPQTPAMPESWLSQTKKELEQWEKAQGLSVKEKQEFISIALNAISTILDGSAKYFDVEVDVSDWRKGDNECLLNVNLTHNNEHLEQGNIWLCLYVDESGFVYMMVGEDGDIEMDLTVNNFWTCAYFQAFCTPQ